jgi:hypothetical protein
VICTALVAPLILMIGFFIERVVEIIFIILFIALCLYVLINTLLYVYLIKGIKFFMKRWTTGFIFVFSIIGLEWV